MTAMQIRNTNEAQQILRDALNLLDAVYAYSINHQLPSDQLFDKDVRERLQSLHSPKLPPPIHSLLEKSDGFTKDEKETLSRYCYKIETSAADFDGVLDGLEAYYKLMHVQNLTSKGELIDTIICGSVSKTIRSVTKILDVIGSLALWHIREEEARALATKRGHTLVSQEDKSDAATEMWQHLSNHNSKADRAKLDERIYAGIRWNRFLDGKEVGMIAAVHPLPHSLKSHFAKLIPIVADLAGTLDRAKKATPCVQKLLDSRLGPWTGSKKRQLPVQSMSERCPKRRPGTEAEIGTPGGSSNSIRALLNAAEQIAAAAQGRQSTAGRSSSTPNRIDMSSPESPVPEETHPFDVEEVHADAEGQPQILTDKDGSTGLESSAKVKDTSHVASGTEIAIMAEVDKLESTLGGYLFNGMNETRMRHQEKDTSLISLTDTVRLHFAYHQGEDFKLEVWVCSLIGKAISQALRSAEDLRSMLGDYLFEGMSKCAGAIDVSFPNADEGSDCKVEVMLNFETGKDVYENVYRR